MFAVLKFARKPMAWLALSLLPLAACGPMPGGGGVTPGKPVPVGLLVPGGSGNAADDSLAIGLENAARLAMAELDGVSIDLRVYNTGGNATQAAALYRETDDSIAAREQAAANRKALGPSFGPGHQQRPNKKQRRNIIQFRQQQNDSHE